MSSIDISLIIPIFNEEGNLKPLIKRINEIFSSKELKKYSYEIICVNDGSSDNSQKELKQLQEADPKITILTFARNFGQTAAFAAGFDHAKGKLLITIDADLQNDPHDIPKMLDLMKQEKADIVAGWRQNRKDPFLRSIISRIANKVITFSTASPVHDLGCSLRVYKRSAIEDLKLYGEMHRFIPVLAAADGATIIEMVVQHHPRKIGHSKYGLTRTFKVLLDLITVKLLTAYRTKPIYMFGFTGFLFFVLSVISGIFVLLRFSLLGGDLVSPMFAIAVIFFTYGVLSILMGLLAEIQVRTWYESSGKKAYILKK